MNHYYMTTYFEHFSSAVGYGYNCISTLSCEEEKVLWTKQLDWKRFHCTFGATVGENEISITPEVLHKFNDFTSAHGTSRRCTIKKEIGFWSFFYKGGFK